MPVDDVINAINARQRSEIVVFEVVTSREVTDERLLTLMNENNLLLFA